MSLLVNKHELKQLCGGSNLRTPLSSYHLSPTIEQTCLVDILDREVVH